MHEDTVDVFGSLFTWSDTWDESASFLDIVRYLIRTEDDERIEEGERYDKCEIEHDSQWSRLLGIDIQVSFNPITHSHQFDVTRLELYNKLGKQIWERNECDREDDRHHSYGIHRDGQ